MGIRISPWGEGGHYDVDSFVDNTMTHSFDFDNYPSSTSIYCWGYKGTESQCDSYAKRHTTNSYGTAVYFNTDVRDVNGRYDYSNYHGHPNEFRITTDGPTLLYLPRDFIGFNVTYVFYATPSSITHVMNDALTVTITKVGIFVDGKKYNENVNAISLRGEAVEQYPPIAYTLAKRSAPEPISATRTITKESCYMENTINVVGSDNYDHIRMSTNTNIYVGGTTNTSSYAYAAGGAQITYPAIGNESILCPIYFTKSILMRVGIDITVKTPLSIDGSTATAFDFTLKDFDIILNYKLEKLKT